MAKLPDTMIPEQPVTALAPMQDVTVLPFMRVIADYGAPDYFFTEYFRVHGHSTLEKHILESITENPSGRPVFAQMIGEDIPHLERTVRLLLQYPVAGIDLNMGCPAPKVYRKNVGGGLLRDPERVDAILGALRAACPGLFTVKMRIGFEDDRHFEKLLELLNRHQVDMLSLHARTVREMYRSEVHYEYIARAVRVLRCPVLANGNVSSVAKAHQVLEETGAAGVMVGRSAIRNPWIFRQLRESFSGQAVFQPALGDVRDYIERLYEATAQPHMNELRHTGRLKKFLNFVGQSVDEEGAFLHAMRRARTRKELEVVADQFLIEGGKDKQPFVAEPYVGLVARPNHESEIKSCGL